MHDKNVTMTQEKIDLAESHFIKGMTSYQAGEAVKAQEYYKRACDLNPQHFAAKSFLGLVHFQCGEVPSAIKEVTQAALSAPSSPNILQNAGIVLAGAERYAESEAFYKKALHFANQDALRCEIMLNLSLLYKRQNHFEKALQCCQDALVLQPDEGRIKRGLALTYFAAGQEGTGRKYLEGLLAKGGNESWLFSELACAYFRCNELEQGLKLILESIKLDPKNREAHIVLSQFYASQGSHHQSSAYARNLLSFSKNDAMAHFLIGTNERELGDLHKAKEHLELAVSLRPQNPALNFSLGAIFKDLGEFDQALHYFKAAQSIKSSDRLRILIASFVPSIMQNREEIQERRAQIERDLNALLEEGLNLDTYSIPSTHFFLAYHGWDDRPIMEKLCTLFRQTFSSKLDYTPPKRKENKKIRLAFISRFFTQHTIGKLMQGIIANFPRDDFELILLSLVHSNEEMGIEIRETVDEYYPLSGEASSLKEYIAGLNIDCLVYTDVGMDITTYLLSLVRMAPMQCVMWGHPVTTGSNTIDYFISCEDMETPNSDKHYTEKLLRFRALPTYYHKCSIQENPKERRDFGLPQENRLYIAPQSLFKFHPDFDPVIAGVLRKDPKGRFVLITGVKDVWAKQLMKRFYKHMPDVMSRVLFLPGLSREDFINVISLCDVMLDTFPFGGGNTTFEGLSIGQPIITLPGEFMRGRITYACYKQMGILDCVASNIEDYIEKSVAIASNPSYREELKNRILDKNDLIFENPAFVTEFADFLKKTLKPNST